VHIEYEARLAQRLRADSGDRANIDRLKHWIDADPSATRKQRGEINRFAIEQDQIPLLHAERRAIRSRL
jgi:hypothetical protein